MLNINPQYLVNHKGEKTAAVIVNAGVSPSHAAP